MILVHLEFPFSAASLPGHSVILYELKTKLLPVSTISKENDNVFLFLLPVLRF